MKRSGPGAACSRCSRPRSPNAIVPLLDEEGTAKIGPPVGGSDIGFSTVESDSDADFGLSADCSSVGDVAECLPTEAAGIHLPFVNVELDGDVIRYGFFTDEEAAAGSDPDSAGEFGETEAYVAGEEALGDDFEYIGAVDLAPILDEFVGGAGIDDVISGASPEELIAGFLAQKLGVVAFGIRYEDDAAIQRYVLSLAE